MAREKSDLVKLFGNRMDEYLADLEEVVEGQGDGAVAVKRGRLAGVDDTILMKFTHMGAIGETAESVHQEMFAAILQRLVGKPTAR